MGTLNIFTDALAADPGDPEGYRGAAVDLGRLLGPSELMVKVIEIAPGNRLCPYHYEYVEEWLVVLSGPVHVRTPAGVSSLADGAVMRFPAGPEGAHQVFSPAETGEPARVLMFSADADPAVCVYPDSDKLAVFTHSGHDEVFVRRGEPTSHLEYYDGELPPAALPPVAD
ncbi:MAG TPA: hypothetical protein VFN48_11890 [Solirubrobacteraceae bacterium]|nr:hypothetical protein [Solirubrobacteraceae bacterium]